MPRARAARCRERARGVIARERELAQAAGRDPSARPHYADEPARAEQVIEFYKKRPDDDG